MENQIINKNKGLYLGTEINQKWWRRYQKNKFFMRGNGQYWYNDQEFYFLRDLTREPITIPFAKIIELKLGKWHSGKWAYGNFIVKIIWQKDGLKLSSGFIVSKNREGAIKLKEDLESKIKA
jgi:hypothetical protein